MAIYIYNVCIYYMYTHYIYISLISIMDFDQQKSKISPIHWGLLPVGKWIDQAVFLSGRQSHMFHPKMATLWL